jgi:pimeloyl-ACP methyl ester carboxylesterase
VTTALSAATWEEAPVFFEAAGETLFGMFTQPAGRAEETAVILLPGGDHIPSINRNRLWVRLARCLAHQGYHVLRFDYHGVGESTGVVEHYELERPFTEDVEGAVTWLRHQGLDEFIVVGICFGAGTGLSCVGRVQGLRGLVACAHPVHNVEVLEGLGTIGYLRRTLRMEGVSGVFSRARRIPSYARFVARRLRRLARRPARGVRDAALARVSPLFLDQLEAAVERRIPTLIVYGTDDGYYERFEAARTGRLGEILDRDGSRVEVTVLEGPAHQLTALGVQAAFIDLVESWLARLDADKRPSSRDPYHDASRGA